jgi:hypothetical protein
MENMSFIEDLALMIDILEDSSDSFMTSELNGGEWSVSCPGHALPPGIGTPASIGQEAGRAPEPVWTTRLEEKSSAPAGIKP